MMFVVYPQAVTPERRVAQTLRFKGLMGALCLCTLSNHDWEQKEEVAIASS
jgi:hypothetical protein